MEFENSLTASSILVTDKPVTSAVDNGDSKEASTLTGLIVFIYKVYCKIFMVHTRLILKLGIWFMAVSYNAIYTENSYMKHYLESIR